MLLKLKNLHLEKLVATIVENQYALPKAESIDKK